MIWIAIMSAIGLLGYASRMLGIRGLVEHRGKVDIAIATILIWYSTVNPSATGMVIALVGGASATLMLEGMAAFWNWQARHGYLKPLRTKKNKDIPPIISLRAGRNYVSRSMEELSSKIDARR